MLNIEKGLSKYVMYYWFNKDGDTIWLTKDGIVNVKNKLDKQFKKYRIKRLVSIGLISFSLIAVATAFITFCIIGWKKLSYEDYCFTTALVKLPVIIIVNLLIFTLSTNIRNHDGQLIYRLKRFKYMYGDYFTLDKYWNKLAGCDAGEYNGSSLSLSELMGRIESRSTCGF